MTWTPFPGAHPIIGFADEARRVSACNSCSGALEQNRNIAACSGARGGGGLHATLSRGGSRRREGKECRICKVLSKRTRASVKSAPVAERTQGPREPADQVQVLAKRTQCLAMDAAVMLVRLRHSTCAGKFIVLFPVVYNEGKILQRKVVVRTGGIRRAYAAALRSTINATGPPPSGPWCSAPPET